MVGQGGHPRRRSFGFKGAVCGLGGAEGVIWLLQYCSNILNSLFVKGYDEIPDSAELEQLVERVRGHCGQGRQRRLDFAAVCDAFGAAIRVAELEAREGGQEAMLVPLQGDRFGIVVDPTPRGGWDLIPKSVRRDLRRHRLRFRVGHELAHTFFYSRRPGDTPQRRLFDSNEQEDFCDRFSRSLLVSRRQVSHMEPTVKGLVELQQACDVSLEVAARAAVATRPELRISIWFEGPDHTLNRQLGPETSGHLTVEELLALEPCALPLRERRQWVSVSQV